MSSNQGHSRARRPALLAGAVAGAVLLLVGIWGALRLGGPERAARSGVALAPAKSARPVNRDYPGLSTFRGNASRTYYGSGPVPNDPMIVWRTPERPLCSVSIVGDTSKQWCGTGWTGQPNVIVHEDGTIEVREGAYDGAYHFLDGGNGAPIRPPLKTRDLAKGSATSDPDGFPLYYGGSRDGYLRVIALDRAAPTVLWQIHSDTSVPRPMRNNDWDGAPLVIDDVLFEGGENGWLYVVRLNRDFDPEGLVTVDPEVVATVPGFDDELLGALDDQEVSIENSVSFDRGVLWFANSGGLVQGWDVSDVLSGGSSVERVFRYWVGDDVDATIAIDDEGDLYVAAEYQRRNERSSDLGQLMKLDPGRPEDPLVWSIDARAAGFEGAGGSWSTPALSGGYVYFTTASGRLLQVRRDNGEVIWETQVGAPAISSPVVVDGVLIQGDCTGALQAWDVSDPSVEPQFMWRLDLPGCIESTPAVWDGWIYVGTRKGFLFGIADGPAA